MLIGGGSELYCYMRGVILLALALFYLNLKLEKARAEKLLGIEQLAMDYFTTPAERRSMVKAMATINTKPKKICCAWAGTSK